MQVAISLSKPYSILNHSELQAFDKWFGKSVIRNSDGTPKVTYHGSPESFDKFNKEFIGSGEDAYGIGLYFTDRADWAQGYTGTNGNIMPVYLKITKPIIYEKQPRMTYTQAWKIAMGLGAEHFREFLGQNYDLDYMGVRAATREYLEAYDGQDVIIGGNNLFIDIYQHDPKAHTFAEVFAKAVNRDGIISKRGRDHFYVVFSPTQIKSSIGNKGTFKPRSGNVID